jgi:iron complex transport system ATP-binding protein
LQKLVKETNKTIIISSHEINLALKLSDQIILMTENKVQFGTTAALISQSAFDTIFPDTLLQFDKTIEQFVIKNS